MVVYLIPAYRRSHQYSINHILVYKHLLTPGIGGGRTRRRRRRKKSRSEEGGQQWNTVDRKRK